MNLLLTTNIGTVYLVCYAHEEYEVMRYGTAANMEPTFKNMVDGKPVGKASEIVSDGVMAVLSGVHIEQFMLIKKAIFSNPLCGGFYIKFFGKGSFLKIRDQKNNSFEIVIKLGEDFAAVHFYPDSKMEFAELLSYLCLYTFINKNPGIKDAQK